MDRKEFGLWLSENREWLDDVLWRSVSKSIAEEIAKGRRIEKAGRPYGSKKWGALTIHEIVCEFAKTAPVSFGCFPNTVLWAKAVAACEEQRLIVPVQPPEFFELADKYYAYVNAPWMDARQPFDFCDLTIANKLMSDRRVTASQFCESQNRGDQHTPKIKIRDVCSRLKAFEAAGLVEFDGSCLDGHVGKYRPRWYGSTEKLESIMCVF